MGLAFNLGNNLMTEKDLEILAVAIQESKAILTRLRAEILPVIWEVQPLMDEAFSLIALAQGEAVIRLMNEKGMTAEQAISIVTGSSQAMTSAINSAVAQLKDQKN